MGAVFVNDEKKPDFGEVEVNVGDVVRIGRTREFVVTEELLQKIKERQKKWPETT